MRLRLITLLAYFFWILVGLSLIGTTLFVWLNTHHVTCVIICQYLGKQHRLHEFEEQFLTLARFKLIRYGSSLLTLLYALISYLFILRISVWANEVNQFLTRLSETPKKKYRLFTPTQRWIGLIMISIFFLIKTYHVYTVPISYDEAWTYLNFSSKSPLITLSYYPAPNNHIFFTLLTNFSSILPLPPVIALRLPNLLILPIAFIGFTFILREWFSGAMALIGSSLLIASYPIQLYSLQARGYLLYILLGAGAFYTIYKLIDKPINTLKFYQWVFILIGVSGLYVMPSFLYVLFSCGVYSLLSLIINTEWMRLKVLVTTGVWILGGTLIVYAPIFLASGWQAVFNNPYVQRYSFSVIADKLIPHFIDTGTWLTGFISVYSYSIILLVILGVITFCFIKPNHHRSLLLLCLSFLLSPFVILLIHKAIPFERTWSYTVFPLITGICYILSQNRISYPFSSLIVLVLCFVILVMGTVLFNRSYPESYARDYDAEYIASVALKQHAHSFYIEEDYYEVLLYYYYTVAHQQYQVDNKQTGQAFNHQKSYDYLLVVPSTASLYGDRYQTTNQGQWIKVFTKK